MDEMPPINGSNSKLPPPLPPQVGNEESSSFDEKAATLSVWAPLLALILTASLYQLVPSTGEWTKIGRLVVFGFGSLLLLTGLVLAIVGLRRSEQNVFGRALAGLLLNATLITVLVLGVPVFYALKAQAHKQKVMADLQESAKKIRTDTKKDYEDTQGTGSSPERLEKFRKSVEDAAHELKGDDALVMNATGAYLKRLQNAAGPYREAQNTILHPPVLDMSEVKEKVDLETKRKMVLKFLSANEEFKDFLKSGDSAFKEELEKLHVSARTTESALRGFRSKRGNIPTIVKIREMDTRIGNATLGMIDILDTNWGKWNYSNDRKNVVFEDHEALEKFNALFKELQTVGRSQAVLQKQVMNTLAE